MTQQYIYTPLPDDEIRVFTITRVEPQVEGTLDAHLLVDIAGQYEALSYVCGLPNYTSTIICNGKRLNITPNLYEILKHVFQFGLQQGQVFPIWIDSICLNQKDNEEMAIHIPRMSEIYPSIRRALVYLSHATPGSDIAMEAIPVLISKLSTIKGEILPTDMATLGIENWTRPLWGDLESLYRSTYFQRVWCLQEAVISPTLVVGVGSKWVTWEQLSELESLLRTCGLGHFIRRKDFSNQNPTERKFSDASEIWVLNNFRTLHAKSSGMTLFDLLASSRDKQCYQPVDRIWGIMGMMRADARDQIKSRELITYTEQGKKEYWTSYIAFAKWYLLNDERLGLLSVASSKFKPDQMPSWCPNWNSRMEYLAYYQLKAYSCGQAGMEDRRRRWKHAKFVPDENSNKLCVQGYRVDLVDQVVDGIWTYLASFARGGDPGGVIAKLLDWERRCLVLAQATLETTTNDIPESYIRTLTGDRFTGAPSTELNHENLKIAYKAWHASITRIIAGPFIDAPKEHHDLINSYNHFVQSACAGRKFFSTKSGRIGLGPTDTKIGDQVCVLYRAYPLFVMRFEENSVEAKLVGDAYVHGLMKDGQAFQVKRDKIFGMRIS